MSAEHVQQEGMDLRVAGLAGAAVVAGVGAMALTGCGHQPAVIPSNNPCGATNKDYVGDPKPVLVAKYHQTPEFEAKYKPLMENAIKNFDAGGPTQSGI